MASKFGSKSVGKLSISSKFQTQDQKSDAASKPAPASSKVVEKSGKTTITLKHHGEDKPHGTMGGTLVDHAQPTSPQGAKITTVQKSQTTPQGTKITTIQKSETSPQGSKITTKVQKTETKTTKTVTKTSSKFSQDGAKSAGKTVKTTEETTTTKSKLLYIVHLIL